MYTIAKNSTTPRTCNVIGKRETLQVCTHPTKTNNPQNSHSPSVRSWQVMATGYTTITRHYDEIEWMKSLKHAGCGGITVPSKFSIVTHIQQKTSALSRALFFCSTPALKKKKRKHLSRTCFPLLLKLNYSERNKFPRLNLKVPSDIDKLRFSFLLLYVWELLARIRKRGSAGSVEVLAGHATIAFATLKCWTLLYMYCRVDLDLLPSPTCALCRWLGSISSYY